jgi:ribosomal protein S18 acetylase RimI-like enzyme
MDASTVTGQVTLRPATDADREFLVAVYASTRAEELSQVDWAPGQREAFVRMQFHAQDVDYHRNHPDGSYDVVEVGGDAAGRLYVDRRRGDIRIVDIALLPQFRGRGCGGRLITQLMDEAAASGSRLSLHVEVHNAAGRLYERLGFVEVDVHAMYRAMEWSAS